MAIVGSTQMSRKSPGAIAWCYGFTTLIWRELVRTRATAISAGLAFYFLLSIIPLFAVFASLAGFLSPSEHSSPPLIVLRNFIPPDSMALIERIVGNVLAPNRGKFLSFGIIGYLWAASGGFTAAIEALDIAYDVEQSRPWWRDRLQALLLTVTAGALLSVSLLTLIAWALLSDFVYQYFPLTLAVRMLFPVAQVVFTLAAFIASVELFYYLGPNGRHSFFSALPGAALAVGCWLIGSTGLNLYLARFSSYNKLYGALGAVIALMLWLYVIALAILIGAEVNGELIKRRRLRRALERGEAPPEPPRCPVAEPPPRAAL